MPISAADLKESDALSIGWTKKYRQGSFRADGIDQNGGGNMEADAVKQSGTRDHRPPIVRDRYRQNLFLISDG
ncbi:hypothetical protein ACVIJ6_006640 [Bradyrhizobium sp. USDA 4369]